MWMAYLEQPTTTLSFEGLHTLFAACDSVIYFFWNYHLRDHSFYYDMKLWNLPEYKINQPSPGINHVVTICGY